ncbi:alpha-L-fucosidase [Streptomyces purpurascens]|uniref:alpha-L-fucosidase n=1 Tax=Streptomyces purpurascens TaxID=1924 RepID=UPI00167245D0|nr:alpha-L-fucosidase [Streptomyces purpurascens]MCE7047782.1 alpha-L-fucosidase [Streptomyces purpurascens]GHA16850.1 alpha-L-fucosidase [Streptomyces purpurascens]
MTQRPETTGPFLPTVESLSTFECPEWFRDAKLGIWSHWGPQSVPRYGDWYARNMYIEGTDQYRYHVRTYGHPSKFGYKDLVARWKAERFDPDELSDLYVRAGARYLVALASHHDNFLNYPSRLHRWNSAEVGPGKDVVGLWSAAAQARGLRFGLSEHLGAAFSWWSVNKGADATGPYAGVPYDGTDPSFEDLYLSNAEHFVPGRRTDPVAPWYTANPGWHGRWLDLVTEMIDRYQPDLLYSDGAPPFGVHGMRAGLRAAAHLYNTSAARHGGRNQAVYTQKERWSEVRRIGVLDVERSQEPALSPVPWQTDTCLGGWFYDVRAVYKSPAHVVELLVDVVAKNGSLLLNVPQLPDGTLDEECRHVLKELAGWMDVCGEGIHGSRSFGPGVEGPSGVVVDGFREERVAWTDADYRLTRRDDTVYVFQMAWPEDRRSIIHSLGPQTAITSVRLLGAGPVEYHQIYPGGELVVELPERPPTPYVNCLAIEVR